MIDFGVYKPLTVTEKEVTDLESKMAQAYHVLAHCAIEWYNFANVKKLRNEYKRGSFSTPERNLGTSNPRAKRMLNEMIAIEEHIISCFIRLGTKMCIRHYKIGRNRSGVIFTDYVNECAMALYDAMYTYNGSSKFTTYATWCMKNRLTDFVRKEDDINGFSVVIRDLRTQVRILVASSNLTIDTAILFLQTSLELKKEIVDQVRSSFFEIQNIYEVDKGCSIKEDVVDEQKKLFWTAMEKTPLSTLELDLIEAYLRGDHKRRNELCQEINPRTGKPYSRATMSQIFLKACDKLSAQCNMLKAA